MAPRSRTPGLFELPPAIAVAVVLIPWLCAGPSAAQDPGLEPEPAAAGTGTVDPAPQATPGGPPASAVEMPPSLRSPTIDFFHSRPTLQARRLRGLKAEVAGLILGDPGGGNIAFEALATPLRGPGGKAGVPLFVEIDGPTFLETNQRDTARVEVYAYALGAGGEVASYLADVFALDVTELGEAVWQSGLKFFGHLELAPGEYRLRILVRNYHSGAAALRELPLDVPAYDDSPRPFVFPVFQPPSARDSWLAIRGWESPRDYPLWIGERAVSPAVRPVLVAGRRTEAHLFAYGLPAGVARGQIELTRDGAAAGNAILDATSARSRTAPEDLEAVAVTFETPQVTPGAYSLRAVLGGATSPALPVIVLPQNTRDRALVWTDLRGGLIAAGARVSEAATAPRDRGDSEPRGRREERRIRKLAASYRQALAALGGGGTPARSALLALETSVLTEGTLETLRAAQLQVAEQLSDQDVESLLPVLALHDDLYAVYRQRRLFSLGFHAREIIELLAELYAERGNTPGARVVAARALASLGGHLQAANLPSSSRRLYRRALAHDARNLAALLGLATSFERYGDYPRAVAVLEDLVAAHPSSGEGQLRLSINLDRLGARGRARTLVERAVESQAPGWVRSLAVQRLARILIEIGDLDRAAELLETSLEELPDQHGSVYLLAHVYDRRRQPHDSLELLDSVAASPDASPRKIYDSWPETSLHAVRRELSEAAAVRRARVAKLLEASASP